MESRKKFSPLTIVHLVLMAGMIVMTLAAAVRVITTAAGLDDPAIREWKLPMYMNADSLLLDIAALGCGIAYVLRSYSKSAAPFFRAFLLLEAFACAANIAANCLLLSMESALEGMNGVSDGSSAARILCLTGQTALLVILAFAKNLGKRRNQAFLAMLIVIAIIMSLLSVSHEDGVWAIFVRIASRIVMTGTIGLAIKGKYDDKDARGTK